MDPRPHDQVSGGPGKEAPMVSSFHFHYYALKKNLFSQSMFLILSCFIFKKKYCISYFYILLGKKDAAFLIIQMIYKNIHFILITLNKLYFQNIK